jgi:hypothetical protein
MKENNDTEEVLLLPECQNTLKTQVKQQKMYKNRCFSKLTAEHNPKMNLRFNYYTHYHHHYR